MAPRSDAPVRAILGPTNTGKTYLAIERMCGHSSGVIGFPLRLLAREVYDRVVAMKGEKQVALLKAHPELAGREAQEGALTPDSSTEQGRLGPVARLLPTTASTTLRKSEPPLVIDGPFAETKEQLLGFYVVECEKLDDALTVARDLGQANPGGSYEIRPIGVFMPGTAA